MIKINEINVFISHSKDDRKIVLKIQEEFIKKGIKGWIYTADNDPTASTWHEGVVKAINSCQYLLLVFSSNANISEYVIKEHGLALKKKKKIIHLLIEEVEENNLKKY